MLIWSNKTTAKTPTNVNAVSIPNMCGKGREEYIERSNQEQKLFDKKNRSKKYSIPDKIKYPYSRFIKKEFIEFCKTNKYYHRLQALKWFAGKSIKTRLNYQIRRSHINIITKDTKCILCGNMADTWHHVIMVCKGGGNDDNNLVPICKECHKKIHPWIK